MSADHSSLVSFLAAPVLVIDPEGHVIYANPAFERRFCAGHGPLQGENLAVIFEGGGREAILSAVAGVCKSGGEVHFRLMEDNRGYIAVASPIESADDRVGVMVLLTDEPKSDERLLTFHTQIQEPLDEVLAVLAELIEQTGGRRSEMYRSLVERGMSAAVRVRKWSDELHGLLTGRRESDEDVSLDPVRVAREVTSTLMPDFKSAGIVLDLLTPAQMPSVQGDAAILQSALIRLMRQRLSEANAGDRVTMTLRKMGEGTDEAVLVAVVDAVPQSVADDCDDDLTIEPRAVREAVVTLRGAIHTVAERDVGRVTAIRLNLASEGSGEG